ncbi:MAG: hypothetical protein KIT31_38740, partial [Deltaproteobacteria bacterium]|nr:hypothetical protein [Deltaproteobacteria bacterium]
MELARGQIADRPWGRTLAAIGLRGVACELVLHAPHGKEFRIAFHGEGIVGATSPLGPDSALQIALTHRYAATQHIPFIHHKLGADPDDDELDIIAEVARLDEDQAMRLRLRTIAQCATRTFAVPEGILTVHDTITLPVRPGAAVDIRAIIYAGARTHYDEDRLQAEVHRFGTHFKLKPEAVDDLGQFGFQRAERELIEPLLVGCNLEELEALHADLPRATVRATVYALVACGAATAAEPIAFTRAPTPTETAIPISIVGDATTRTRAATATSEHVVGDLVQSPDAPEVTHRDHPVVTPHMPSPMPPPAPPVSELQLPATNDLADLSLAPEPEAPAALPVLPATNDLADLALAPEGSGGLPPASAFAPEPVYAAAAAYVPPPVHAHPYAAPEPAPELGDLIADAIGESSLAAPPPSLLGDAEQFAPP